MECLKLQQKTVYYILSINSMKAFSKVPPDSCHLIKLSAEFPLGKQILVQAITQTNTPKKVHLLTNPNQLLQTQKTKALTPQQKLLYTVNQGQGPNNSISKVGPEGIQAENAVLQKSHKYEHDSQNTGTKLSIDIQQSFLNSQIPNSGKSPIEKLSSNRLFEQINLSKHEYVIQAFQLTPRKRIRQNKAQLHALSVKRKKPIFTKELISEKPQGINLNQILPQKQQKHQPSPINPSLINDVEPFEKDMGCSFLSGFIGLSSSEYKYQKIAQQINQSAIIKPSQFPINRFKSAKIFKQVKPAQQKNLAQLPKEVKQPKEVQLPKEVQSPQLFQSQNLFEQEKVVQKVTNGQQALVQSLAFTWRQISPLKSQNCAFFSQIPQSLTKGEPLNKSLVCTKNRSQQGNPLYQSYIRNKSKLKKLGGKKSGHQNKNNEQMVMNISLLNGISVTPICF